MLPLNVCIFCHGGMPVATTGGVSVAVCKGLGLPWTSPGYHWRPCLPTCDLLFSPILSSWCLSHLLRRSRVLECFLCNLQHLYSSLEDSPSTTYFTAFELSLASQEPDGTPSPHLRLETLLCSHLFPLHSHLASGRLCYTGLQNTHFGIGLNLAKLKGLPVPH